MRPTSLSPAYSALIRKHGQPLTREEEAALIPQAKAGDKAARDKLLLANMRMALVIARRFENTGVPVDDMMQAAVEGMMRALEKFDASRGHRFYTYATWWMNAKVRNYLAEHEVRVRSMAWGALRAGREFTAEVMGKNVFSLDAQIPHAGGGVHEFTFLDRMPDNSLPDPDDVLSMAGRDVTIRRRLRRMRETLTPIEQDILDNRLMVDRPDAATLEEIAARNPVTERLNGTKMARPTLTRERVRQIEISLKKRLRNVLEDLRDAA